MYRILSMTSVIGVTLSLLHYSQTLRSAFLLQSQIDPINHELMHIEIFTGQVRMLPFARATPCPSGEKQITENVQGIETALAFGGAGGECGLGFVGGLLHGFPHKPGQHIRYIYAEINRLYL